MNAAAADLLCCPFCLDSIRVEAVFQGADADIQYGLLRCCECRFDFPIIGGVVFIQGPEDVVDIKAETTALTTLKGPSIWDLVQLLKSGDHVRALGLLLGPTSDAGQLFPELSVQNGADNGLPHRNSDTALPGRRMQLRRGGRILRVATGAYRRTFLPRAQQRIADFLESHRHQLSALDAIDLYYRKYSGVETFNYFAFRFGQPRHLAGLGTASLFQFTEGPLLDLACGLGHLTHHFTCAHPTRTVFGVDRDFFRLYVARNFVSPQACYICAPADLPLPFKEHVFGGIFCSDAFHYFLHRAATIRELARLLARGGALVLSRFGNAEAEPREGYELSIEGYRRLLRDLPHVLLGEEELVSRYLEQTGPDLRAEAPLDLLRKEKWISVIASPQLDQLPSAPRFEEWPHGIGTLQINPIFNASPGRDGSVDLEFRFPSPWYEFENRRYRDYTPNRCCLDRSTVEALRRRQRTPSMAQHVNQFVLLGMPDRYWRASGTPVESIQYNA